MLNVAHSESMKGQALTEPLAETELELRNRLMLLAKSFFLQQGYSSSTMDQVAKTAKVSKKTIYRLFRSKEEVLRSVVQSIRQEIEELTDPLFRSIHESFFDRFERLIVQISPQYAQLRSPRSLKEMRIAAPVVYDEFDEWRRWRFSLFVKMLSDERDTGSLSKDFEFDEMVAIYAALHNSCMDYSIMAEEGVSADEAYRAFVDLFLNGIMAGR